VIRDFFFFKFPLHTRICDNHSFGGLLPQVILFRSVPICIVICPNKPKVVPVCQKTA